MPNKMVSNMVMLKEVQEITPVNGDERGGEEDTGVGRGVAGQGSWW